MTIPQWTGKEIRALREARRMSVRDFASHLGVSDRMVSKWESGGESIRPRSSNQASLDTSLATCGPEARTRFERLAGGAMAPVGGYPSGAVRHLVRHPVDDRLMTLVEPGPYAGRGGELVWLTGYYIDVLPVTCGEYAEFLHQTDHRPPAHWPGGALGGAMAETPVQVPWIDAQSYAAWAGKALPTPVQWDRAAAGEEGMVASHLAEWCATHRGPRRHQPPAGGGGGGQPGFRCALPVEEMLALLAI